MVNDILIFENGDAKCIDCYKRQSIIGGMILWRTFTGKRKDILVKHELKIYKPFHLIFRVLSKTINKSRFRYTEQFLPKELFK